MSTPLREPRAVLLSERAALLLGDDSLDKFTIYDMIEVEEPVANEFGYVDEESAIINIHAYSTNKEDAVRVANAVADAYVMEVTSITMSNSVQVLDEAYDCAVTYNARKNQLLYILAITAVGFLLSCMIIILHEVFSSRVRSLKQGSLYGELEIIGVIPMQEK